MRRECQECFPRHRLQRKPLVSDPGMHHVTCVTHVPWCMSGSITRRCEENVPGIPVACTTRNFAYLARRPWNIIFKLAVFKTCGEIFTLYNEYVSIFVKLIKSNIRTSILTQESVHRAHYGIIFHYISERMVYSRTKYISVLFIFIVYINPIANFIVYMITLYGMFYAFHANKFYCTLSEMTRIQMINQYKTNHMTNISQ